MPSSSLLLAVTLAVGGAPSGPGVPTPSAPPEASGGASFGFGEATPPPGPRPSESRGLVAWRAHCAPCHGRSGGGDGPAASWLAPPPRNLTRGEFKWNSRPSGQPPLDEDLLRTLEKGAPGTAMPAFEDRLPPETLRSLVEVIKGMSTAFDDLRFLDPPLVIPEPPEDTPELRRAGRAAFEALKCTECHGEEGRADGPAVPTLRDSEKRPITPRNFRREAFKGGRRFRDVYRTISTGLDGTPMPAHAQQATAEERSALVFYVLSLREERSWFERFVGLRQELER